LILSICSLVLIVAMPVLSTATGFLTLLNLPMPTLGDARRGRQSSRRFDQRHAPYRPFAVGSSRL